MWHSVFIELENVREYGGKNGLDVTMKAYQPRETSYYNTLVPHHTNLLLAIHLSYKEFMIDTFFEVIYFRWPGTRSPDLSTVTEEDANIMRPLKPNLSAFIAAISP